MPVSQGERRKYSVIRYTAMYSVVFSQVYSCIYLRRKIYRHMISNNTVGNDTIGNGKSKIYSSIFRGIHLSIQLNVQCFI